MPNGRDLFVYAFLGLLISIAVSSFLYWIVYPQTIRTIVTEDTVHNGDLIISRDQEFIVIGVTFINDGNIIVKDQAKLVLRNAALIINQSDPKSWLGGREPTGDEPINYPLYSLNLYDNAQFEASDSTIKTPTTQHFKVLVEDEAKVVLIDTNVTETLYFMDDSTGSITNSFTESMSLGDRSVVSISDSTLPQSWFFLAQNAVVSINNSTMPRGGEIHFWSYFGNVSFDRTRIRVRLRVENSSFRILGSITFDEGSEVSHIVRDSVVHWNWETSSITRSHGIEVTHSNGAPFPNVSLNLRSSRSGELLWSGLTDERGKATVEVTFTDENFLDSYELYAKTDGLPPKEHLTYLTLLSETPVDVSL